MDLRRWRRTPLILALAAATLLAASCGGDQHGQGPEPVASSSSALNTSPKISDFALYAQRSVTLGASDQINGGDVGVSTAASPSFGTQLRVGSSATVQMSHSLLAPSVSLASGAHVGDVQTNSLTNNGGTFGTQASFPGAAMPVPVLGAPTGSGGSNVNVPAFTITILSPGNYGTLSVTGTVLLSAGSYTFTSVTMANQAHLGVVSGTATVSVAGSFSAGQFVTIASPGFQPAGQLVISVAGSDSGGAAAFSVGPSAGISALLSAPHGTLSLGNSTTATGAFGGFDVSVGAGCTITYQSGFSPSPKGQQQLTGYVNPAVASAPLVGPVPPSTPVSLSFGLPVPNLQALQTFVHNVSDPTNSAYRHFVSVATFAANYGPSAAAYGRLTTWAQTRGLTTSSFPNNMVLSAQGTAAAVEQALHLNLNYYLRPDGTQFYSLDRDPSLDLADSVLAIQGLDNFVLPKAAILPNGNLMGNDFNVAYDGPAASVSSTSCGSQTGLYGSGQSIGIFAFVPSGIPSGTGFYQSDISSYVQAAQANSLSSAFAAITPTAPTVVPAGVPLSATTPVSGADTIETSMDIEVAYSMAPQAQVYVFEGSNPNDILSAMATQAGLATPLVNQLSTSWEQCDDQATQQILYEFAAQGQSFFISSGDNGAYPEDPSLNFNCRNNQLDTDDLDAATLVGGTQLTLQGPSSNFPVDANPEAWSSEVSWSCPSSSAVNCSGGGILTTQPLPTYQAGLSSLNSQASSSHRNVPDVAMVAWQKIKVFYDNLSQQQVSGGTSASSPLWAGYMALVNEKNASNNTTIGFANPAIYAIGEDATAYAACFHDMADGQSNQGFYSKGVGYTAVAGYDLVTGWGSPTCQLIGKLACATTCGTTECVDLDTTANHCGTCNNACGTGLSCCAASCHDLTSDPNNCGACARSCLGAACISGVCQPVTLAAVDAGITALAVDLTSVYWTSLNSDGSPGVFKVPLGGGSVVQLSNQDVSAQAQGIGIAVDGTNVYWTDDVGTNSSTLRAVPVGGGTTATVASNAPEGVAVDANNVYWAAGPATPNSGAIMKMPKSGGTPVALASGLASPLGIAVNSTSVFWTDFTNGLIMSVPIAGGAPVTVASNQSRPFAIAADNTSVYWNNDDTSPQFTGNGSVMKAPVGGGAPVTLASAQRISRGAIAIDGQSVYWVASVDNAGSSGEIMKVPLGGGAATSIVPSGAEVYGMAVDRSAVYYVTLAGGAASLMKVAK
jgi:hypothetical protein